MRRTWLYIFITLALISTSITACTSTQNAEPTPTPLPPVASYTKSIYTVERGPIVSELTAQGEVVPIRQDNLFFRASGFVTRAVVKKGDMVQAGDILAELQIDDLLNQLEQSNIEYEAAQAALEQNETQRQFAISRAEHEVKIWEIRVEQAQLNLDNAVGATAQESARLNLLETQENLELAKISLQQATTAVSLNDQQAVDRAGLAVERLETLISERRITAPYDGIILTANIKDGNSVDAFAQAFVIGDPTELVVRTKREYPLVSEVNKDTEVQMQADVEGESTSYRVEYLPDFLPVSSQAGESTSTDLNDWLYFSFPQELVGKVPVGRLAKLTIVLGRKEDALLLPPMAIREYRGVNFVIVIEGDAKRRVDLYQIGLKTTERWEIFGDIKEGDQVLGP